MKINDIYHTFIRTTYSANRNSAKELILYSKTFVIAKSNIRRFRDEISLRLIIILK